MEFNPDGAGFDVDCREALFERAIDHFTVNSQVVKAIEELSELTTELSRYLITDGLKAPMEARIRAELANVMIMSAQLAMIFDVNDNVPEIIDSQLLRLQRRLDQEASQK